MSTASFTAPQLSMFLYVCHLDLWRFSDFMIGFNTINKRRCDMRATQQLSITLPNEMADVVKAKVNAGEYASESEVIRDGLRTLIARDRAVEAWLLNEVGLAWDALKADPSRAVTTDQVRARLTAEHVKSK
jgi:putative addiction module CopG family antidote